MAEVTGPISRLPGSLHVLPAGTMCDDHPDVPAVARIQGETDSFGSELLDVCQVCLDGIRAYEQSPEAQTGRCDWCHGHVTDLRNTRDYDEGPCGRVYRVCGPCRRKAGEEAARELDEFGDYD